MFMFAENRVREFVTRSDSLSLPLKSVSESERARVCWVASLKFLNRVNLSTSSRRIQRHSNSKSYMMFGACDLTY